MESAWWSAIAQGLKQYGPLVAMLSIFVYWQWKKIDDLLDRNSSIYQGEIERLAAVQSRLLDKILGPQASSSESPTVEDLKDKAKEAEIKKEE